MIDLLRVRITQVVFKNLDLNKDADLLPLIQEALEAERERLAEISANLQIACEERFRKTGEQRYFDAALCVSVEDLKLSMDLIKLVEKL